MDVDTADPDVAEALAHTGWTGRLRITTCLLCALFTTIYLDVATDGSTHWSARTVRPENLSIRSEEPPAVRLVPASRRPGPDSGSAWYDGGSTLGGFPDWIQEAEHAKCAACAVPMDYIGHVNDGDLHQYGEGAYYLFLHAPCRLAAVLFQTS